MERFFADCQAAAEHDDTRDCMAVLVKDIRYVCRGRHI